MSELGLQPLQDRAALSYFTGEDGLNQRADEVSGTELVALSCLISLTRSAVMPWPALHALEKTLLPVSNDIKVNFSCPGPSHAETPCWPVTLRCGPSVPVASISDCPSCGGASNIDSSWAQALQGRLPLSACLAPRPDTSRSRWNPC